MPCYYPLTGYRSRAVNASGKRSIVFNRDAGQWYAPIPLPCGRCIGCRLETSRQWALRCVAEAQLHADNCFLTLTLDDDHLVGKYLRGYDPETGDPIYGGTLVKKHFQDFMKRLRRPLPAGAVQYFHCGEYGERKRRPHYHAVLFGIDFPDKHLHRVTPRGDQVFTSEALSRLWGMGFATIGAVTFESAAYVARYVVKKVNGALAPDHYREVDQETGEVLQLEPEYRTMSLKPAVGLGWYERFQSDVFPSDEFVSRGQVMKPPKYFAKLYEHDQPLLFQKVKEARIAGARSQKHNSTPERLRVRETVKLAQIRNLKRGIE